MKNLVKEKIFCISIVLIVIGNSCKKAIEIDKPTHLVVTDAVFADDKTATSAILGIYSRLMQNRYSFACGAITLYPSMSADEIYSTSPDGTFDAYANNILLPTDGAIVNSFWKPAYFHIYQANACIEGINNSNTITGATRKQLLGEAKFVRAFCYFNLVNLFGDAPLITTTDYRLNATAPRTASTEIYQQIISDLKEAQNLLADTYPTSGRVRPNKLTATALLARVYLYQKDWSNSEAQASVVINSGIYGLVNNLDNVFLPNSNEIIWQLMPVINNQLGNNSPDGFLFVPFDSNTIPTISINANLLNAFEANDNRLTSWIGKNIVNSQSYFYPAKYKIRNTFPSAATEYYVVFRLAEQYLIRAEARAQQNNISGAQSDLNTIRTRAGLSNTTANDKANLLLAIEHERQVELFTEWGHRWFDLKRTNRADAVLAAVKGSNWQTTDVLYPIPFSEIKLNSSLIQNPGY